ncbi:MAG: hypothetical protein CR994_00790 [Maribacter sp.]|nr:MAG: hypothetical protein CR994_00790 [Maribacter sp.]
MAKKGLVPRGLSRNDKSFFGSIPRTLGSRLLIGLLRTKEFKCRAIEKAVISDNGPVAEP